MAETAAPGKAAAREKASIVRTLERWSPALLERDVYPGISIDESQVVRDWLRAHGRGFSHFAFNHRVGDGDRTGPSLGARVDRMWALITRRRLDVVAYSEHGVVIVEAKEHARMPAVTQVTRYAREFHEAQPLGPRPIPVLIARSADLGVARAIQDQGGMLQLFPLPGQPPEAEA